MKKQHQNKQAVIHILGSCSGTEPMPGRHHTSWVLETGGRLYFFDAGENCSYTAHLKGLDLTRTRHIFISHPHMDHVGGLGNLLWTIRKLCSLRKDIVFDAPVTIHTPSLEQLEGIFTMLRFTEGNFVCPFEIVSQPVNDGILLDDGPVRVEAMRNRHLPQGSYSYRIAVGGKTVVYSGDIKDIDDLAPWLDCDLLMLESGHHSPEAVCRRIRETGAAPGQLLWLHHGREILNDPAGARRRAEAAWGAPLLIAEDGMTLPFP